MRHLVIGPSFLMTSIDTGRVGVTATRVEGHMGCCGWLDSQHTAVLVRTATTRGSVTWHALVPLPPSAATGADGDNGIY